MAISSGVRGYWFADLRGFTRVSDTRGDQAAAEMLDAYLAIVHGVLASHAGAELRTEGDGVYAVFPSPSAAVAAAVSLVEQATTANNGQRPALPVAVGVHAGESVDSGGSFVGSAVNIAARICAKAEAGEVLVSGTVRALTRTLLPYRFIDLGAAHLKGVAEAVPIYRVEPGTMPSRRRVLRQVRARRRTLGAIALLGVLLVVAGASVWAVNRPAACLALPTSTRDVLVQIDAARACVVATTSVGRRPIDVVMTASEAWIAAADDWTVQAVDRSGTVKRTLGVPGRPVSLAATPGGDLYVLAKDDRTSRTLRDPAATVALINGRDEQLREASALPVGPVSQGTNTSSWSGLTFWGDWAWVTNPSTGDVAQVKLGGDGSIAVHPIDPPSAGGSRPTPGGGAPASRVTIDAIGATDGALWVARRAGPRLFRLSENGAATEVPLDDRGGSTAMAATRLAVWLLRVDGALTRFDPSTRRATSVALEGKWAGLAATDDVVWLMDAEAHELARFAVDAMAIVDTIELGGIPSAVVVDDAGTPWVTLRGP